MPSTNTLTAFYSFANATNTVIRCARVESNFDAIRGHYIPIDPNTTTAGATKTWDLGGDGHRWRYVYGKILYDVVSTTGSMTLTNTNEVVLFNTTAATLTATLPTAVGLTGSSFTLKNIGTAGKTLFLDANGAELIDNTLTVNLVDNESTSIVSDGAGWWTT